jgi:uncharacterized protein YuzE
VFSSPRIIYNLEGNRIIVITFLGDLMKITFDKKAFKTEMVTDDTIADMDKKGNVIGIELISVSSRIPLEQLSGLEIKQLA